MLESEVNRYHGSFVYYYILGICYLRTGIHGVALTYLKLAREQQQRNPDVLLALAVLYLNHGDTDKAVDLYLEVQMLDARNAVAKKALRVIKKNPAPQEVAAWIASGKLPTLFPPLPRAQVSAVRAALSAVLCALAVSGALIFAGVKQGLITLPSPSDQRTIPLSFELTREDWEAPVQTTGSFRYVLTRAQVQEQYDEVRRLFLAHRDNAARVRVNHLLESNAPDVVKNAARVLSGYFEPSGFDTLKADDRFGYYEVLQNPFLYRDVYVIWRGMASNLVVEENSTRFDFLVGYDTRSVLEGIVQVDYDFAVPINDRAPLEILGTVVPIAGERGIRIQGTALHQAGAAEGK
jgi:hypothetical protein